MAVALATVGESRVDPGQPIVRGSVRDRAARSVAARAGGWFGSNYRMDSATFSNHGRSSPAGLCLGTGNGRKPLVHIGSLPARRSTRSGAG